MLHHRQMRKLSNAFGWFLFFLIQISLLTTTPASTSEFLKCDVEYKFESWSYGHQIARSTRSLSLSVNIDTIFEGKIASVTIQDSSGNERIFSNTYCSEKHSDLLRNWKRNPNNWREGCYSFVTSESDFFRGGIQLSAGFLSAYDGLHTFYINKITGDYSELNTLSGDNAFRLVHETRGFCSKAHRRF